MTRFILAILIALSLAGSPGPAFAAPSPACSMPGAAVGNAVDHDTMDCCTPDCAVSCPAAVVPAGGLSEPSVALTSDKVSIPVVAGLHSLNPAAVDPPPRPSLA